MELEATGQAVSAQGSAETGAQAPAQSTSTQAPQTADIDGFSEFSFQGQKYTPQALAKILKEREEFGQSVESFKSYHDAAQNLKIDLATIARRPDLVDQFLAKYPEEMHFLVDSYRQDNRQTAPQETQQSSLPREFTEKLAALERELGGFKQEKFQAQVAQQEAWLQKNVDPLFDKYPYASSEPAKQAVFAQAHMMSEQGYKMTEAAWDRLVKETHLSFKKHADDLRQREIKAQQEKNADGLDTGAGGSAPGQAPPKGARTLDEATRQALAAVMRR